MTIKIIVDYYVAEEVEPEWTSIEMPLPEHTYIDTSRAVALTVMNVILDSLTITDAALDNMQSTIAGMHETLTNTKERLLTFRRSLRND